MRSGCANKVKLSEKFSILAGSGISFNSGVPSVQLILNSMMKLLHTGKVKRLSPKWYDDFCEEIKTKVQQALENVSLVVDDYLPIIKNVKDALKYSSSDKFNKKIPDLTAQQGYLTWLLDSNFIFYDSNEANE